MVWNPRQPKWPLFVALGCLFVLTLAAPSWWHRRQRPQSVGEANAPRRVTAPLLTSAFPVEHPSVPEPAPTLPPLAQTRPLFDEPVMGEAQIAAPSQVDAVVESDDYVVEVDEPPVEAALALAPPPSEAELQADAVPVDVPPSAVAESFANAGGQSVLVRSVPAPELPARPAITLEALRRARTALVTLMDEAQRRTQLLAERAAALAAASRAPQALPPRVVVNSENDRLAMIPDLAEPAITPAPVEFPATEIPAVSPLARPPVVGHLPAALVRDLRLLTPATPAAAWADAVLATIDQLTTQPAPDDATAAALVEELRRLSSVGFNDALAVADPASQSAWIRASRAIDRRLPIWTLLVDERAMRQIANAPTAGGPDDAALLHALNEVAALTAGATEGAAWRSYLRLDDLAGLASVGGDDYRDARRAAAREVLLRMASPTLTAAQRAFLAQPPLAALAHDLAPWAGGDVSLDALTELIEKYELNGSLDDAEAIAELRLRMKWSGNARLVTLADDLNRNYRNANLRIAVSEVLFNRMIPRQEPTVTPVREHIANADVRGRSRTETNVRLRLIPDPTMWRMGLEVDGQIVSRTYSDVGPARVHNVSHMNYQLSKQIMLNRDGLHISPAEAQVSGRNSLAGVESTLDPVPIVGSIVEDVIRRRHRESQGAAVAQVKSKVKRQARERMDREADAGLHAFEDRFATNLLGSLVRFDLSAEPVDMSTTEERAVMRLRLAREQQLGAHTPRPSAPSDSVASVQLHESALNNAIRALGLDGKRLTLGELHALLAEKFTNRPVAPPADLPQRAIVEFAARDAVRIGCRGDRIELTLNIVEMRRGRDSIRNVGVHAFFVAKIDGLEVKLVRDGGLQFEGAHLRTGPRLVLHSVFGKLLRKDQEVPLLAARLGEDPRLQGLMVTQLVIDDGWVAMSMGPATPERTAWRTRGATTK